MQSILQELEINQQGDTQLQNGRIRSHDNYAIPNQPVDKPVDVQHLRPSTKTTLISKHSGDLSFGKHEREDQYCPHNSALKEHVESRDRNEGVRVEPLIPDLGASAVIPILETSNSPRNPAANLPKTDEAICLRELVLYAGSLTYNGVELSDPVNKMGDTFVTIVHQSSYYTLPS